MTQTDVMDAEVVTATGFVVAYGLTEIAATVQWDESTGERETPQDLMNRLADSLGIPDDEEIDAFVDGEGVAPEDWAKPIAEGAQKIEFAKASGEKG